jgi:aminoglycoside phosphotransferase (APT) family kinase protein
MSSPDAEGVAALFGLGQPVAAPRRLAGLSLAQVFMLETRLGGRRRTYVVKRSVAPTVAGSRLERAARAAGVRTAAPMEPPAAGSFGLWAPYQGAFVRVNEYVRGRRPPVPARPRVGSWLGRTIATMAALKLAADPGQSTPVAVRWPEVADRRLAATLREYAAIVEAADQASTVLCHRDLTASNIVLNRGGPVLLDFDHSGPAQPWFEVVQHALLLACADIGRDEPDPATVRAAVAGYRDAGGEVGSTDERAFAGLLVGLGAWVAACAERGDRVRFAQARVSLPLVRRGLSRWTRLLR